MKPIRAEDPDRELLELIRRGGTAEHVAIKELWEKYAGKLPAHLKKFLRTLRREDAEDCALQAFYEAIRDFKLGRFRGDSWFQTWLFGFGENKVKQLVEKETTQKCKPPPPDGIVQGRTTRPGLEDLDNIAEAYTVLKDNPEYIDLDEEGELNEESELRGDNELELPPESSVNAEADDDAKDVEDAHTTVDDEKTAAAPTRNEHDAAGDMVQRLLNRLPPELQDVARRKLSGKQVPAALLQRFKSVACEVLMAPKDLSDLMKWLKISRQHAPRGVGKEGEPVNMDAKMRQYRRIRECISARRQRDAMSLPPAERRRFNERDKAKKLYKAAKKAGLLKDDAISQVARRLGFSVGKANTLIWPRRTAK